LTDQDEHRLRILEQDTHLLAILDRPSARNAIDWSLVEELHELCRRLEQIPKVLVITGVDGVFASGADIRELRDRGPEDALRGINSRVFERISNLPLPTIAAIDGPAFGGGAELAYACDFRIASQRAKFGNPETNLGIIAGAGACWRLKEMVGLPLATEMLLAGRQLDANEALAHGLVMKVVPSEELESAASAIAQRIGKGSSLALRLTKLALKAPATSHPMIDEIAQAVLFQTDEKYQRMTNFLEKRGNA
jgi:enoyl-CoA hydratase